jgi:DNA polymerase-1
MDMTAPPQPGLRSEAHDAYLAGAAISAAVLNAAGVRSEGDQIVFPWTDGELTTRQTRQWPEPEGGLPDGVPKYRWEASRPLHLWAIRPAGAGTKTVLLVEGTKQALAVASQAAPEHAVYAMAGCDGWRKVKNLSRFAGMRVIIALDADAASNHEVYVAGELLAAKLKAAGAEPAFIPGPGGGKDGIDDFLAGFEAAERPGVLARLISQSEVPDRKGNMRPRDKPADRKPAFRPPVQFPDTGNRPMVVVNDDRREVIRRTLFHLKQLWDGQYLFSYGGVLTRLRIGSDDSGQVTSAVTEPLERGAFAHWLSEGVFTCKHVPATAAAPERWEPAWPELITLEALLAAGEQFAPLDRLSRTPYIRTDGSVCAKPGYDPASRTYLATGNSGMDRLDIPDAPAREQARQAAHDLLHGWLGPRPEQGLKGIAFRDEASRANALALVLTPFIRSLVPLVPLAVVSGLQPGVGKGLLGDCLSLMLTGENVSPLSWSALDDEENRKQITSAFREGASTLMWFDEAHQIESPALSRAITSIAYADRILGVSRMARYPNRATWLATGNQVQVSTDMARRAYFIEIYPADPDPQDRPEDTFTHPDIRSWTQDSRPELTTAALTVIRAWFAAGCPAHDRGASMGSFERWDKMMSGILAYAGVSGFLGNLTAKRAERDTTGGYWTEHARWLAEVFGAAEFTALDVKRAAEAAVTNGGAGAGQYRDTGSRPEWFARAAASTWEAPPRLNRYADDAFTRDLGQAYARNQDRWYGGWQIVKTGTGHGTKALWRAVSRTDPSDPSDPSRQNETLPDLGGMDRMDQNLQPGAEVSSKTGDLVYGWADGSDGSPQPTPRVRAGADTPPPARVKNASWDLSGPSDIPPAPVPGAGPVLGFDLETADVKELFRRQRGYRSEDGAGYVRLNGVTGPSASSILPLPQLLALLQAAGAYYGHNILGFDGLALAWHEGLDWDSFCAKARDTEIIARQYWPPRSREKGHSADKLGLDAVAQLLQLPGKTDDLARLAELHGGYDKIPLDDAEYRSYLEGDLDATRGVAGFLLPCYDADPYLPREHRLAAITGHMSLNGLAIDIPLLKRRLEAGEQRKREALQVLHDGWGLPLSRAVLKGRGAGKHEETEEFGSPLVTDEGRAWLGSMWERYQVPAPPLTPKGKLALGADVLAEIASDPSCPADLRMMLTLMGIVTTTRTIYQTAQAWLCPDGRVHPRISARQASGRWSFTEPGLTVFGKRAGRHIERDIIVASEGNVLLSFDLRQVDMRAIAGHCQDPAYMALFADGAGDAHSAIAARVFGDMPRDAKGRHPRRQDAKIPGHGWNYGMGPDRMIEDGISPDVAYGFDEGMKAGFPVLCGWREDIRSYAKAGGILDNGFGRRMRAEPRHAHTVAPALMGQGGARDIMGECLLRLDRGLDKYLTGLIHDEILLDVPAAEAAEVAAECRRAMTWEWRGVPVRCDEAGPAHSWGELSAKD